MRIGCSDVSPEGICRDRGNAIDAAANLKAAEVQLAEVKQANEVQAKAIERITAQRAADDASKSAPSVGNP